MPIIVIPDLFPFAKELRAIVETSNPTAQGRVFARGRGYGLSNRTMAGMAGCSESHVRNILKVSELPIADQALIESGAPYKPFLKKIVPQDAECEQEARVATEAEIDCASKRGAIVLARWCEIVDIGGPYAAQVLVDVKKLLSAGEAKGSLKPSIVTWQGTAEEAFAASKWSDDSCLRGVDKLNAAIRAVAGSLARLIPNADARSRAINVALANPSLRGTGR